MEVAARGPSRDTRSTRVCGGNPVTRGGAIMEYNDLLLPATTSVKLEITFHCSKSSPQFFQYSIMPTVRRP